MAPLATGAIDLISYFEAVISVIEANQRECDAIDPELSVAGVYLLL